MDISEIIKRRGNPGILIYSASHLLLYANQESLSVLPELRTDAKAATSALDEIHLLINQVMLRGEKKAENKEGPCAAIPLNASGRPHYLRAFPIGEQGKDDKAPENVLILIEKVAEKHHRDFDHAKAEFGLSNREVEVLKLLCSGLSNKELADKLGICEYTIKDHMKNLMQKTGASSRTEIMARLMDLD